jgi:hypothetical protein
MIGRDSRHWLGLFNGIIIGCIRLIESLHSIDKNCTQVSFFDSLKIIAMAEESLSALSNTISSGALHNYGDQSQPGTNPACEVRLWDISSHSLR